MTEYYYLKKNCFDQVKEWERGSIKEINCQFLLFQKINVREFVSDTK